VFQRIIVSSILESSHPCIWRQCSPESQELLMEHSITSQNTKIFRLLQVTIFWIKLTNWKVIILLQNVSLEFAILITAHKIKI